MTVGLPPLRRAVEEGRLDAGVDRHAAEEIEDRADVAGADDRARALAARLADRGVRDPAARADRQPAGLELPSRSKSSCISSSAVGVPPSVLIRLAWPWKSIGA